MWDETAGTIMVEKFLQIIEYRDENSQQLDDEIRKLRNIIKDHEKCQQKDEKIRKLRNIFKEHDYKIKVIKGTEKKNNQRKMGTSNGMGTSEKACVHIAQR